MHINEWRKKHPNDPDAKVSIENVKLDINRLQVWERVLKTLYKKPETFVRYNGYCKLKK